MEIRSAGNGYSSDSVRQKFTGKEWESEAQLNYFLARYHSPIQGRFTSVDPENAGAILEASQSWNGYAYALNNPLLYTDPDGLRVEVCYGEGDARKCFEYSDKQWEDARESLLGAGFSIKGGKILNDVGEQTGTFTRLSDDTGSPLSNALLFGPQSMEARADGIQGLIWGTIRMGAAGGLLGGVGLVTFGGGSGITTLGLAGGTGAATGAGTGAAVTIGTANKLHHIFGKAAHNLGPLVAKYGSEAAAYAALETAVIKAVTSQGITGVYQIVVTVGGLNVTVRGAVVNGVVKIGTAFR